MTGHRPIRVRRPRVTKLGALSLSAFLLASAASLPAFGDPWVDGFRSPPQSARPFVWWHWMNGNVSQTGIEADFDWFQQIGLGGVQVLEAGLDAPDLVPERVLHGSPAWREALRRSATLASERGMAFGVATSAGWSATGGPDVLSQDAMKKLVWSRLQVQGGRRLTLTLPSPPDVTGPYQDIPLAAVSGGEGASLRKSGTVAVLAYPTRSRALSPAAVRASAGAVDLKALGDGRLGELIQLPADENGQAWIEYDFGRVVEIGAAEAALPARKGFGSPNPPLAEVAASLDGKAFATLTTLAPDVSGLRSASFAPVLARFVRLRLSHDPGPSLVETLDFAPGALRPPPTRAAKSYGVGEFVLWSSPRVRDAAAKAGFSTLQDYYGSKTPPASQAPSGRAVDLTDRVGPDGVLHWKAPRGDWTILRFGWSLTGHQNAPAPAEATGLEVDKLDAGRVETYIERHLDAYRQAVGEDRFGRRGLNMLLSDSIEAGAQNWTETLPAEFRRRRGYALTPWLPALTGEIIESSERTERFLYDYRQTIAELYADAHYAVIARAAHRAGLEYYAEALEDHRPQLGDDLAMRAPADVPMGAMWAFDPAKGPRVTNLVDLKGAASVADLYDRRLVAAEALTVFGHPWGVAPADGKPALDLAFALGVNRPIIHSSVHQPVLDATPGLALRPTLGQYFNRNETWAPFARSWTDYMARTAFLLQQGRRVIDIAYLPGEESSITGLYGDRLPDGLPSGHDYDFVNAAALRTQLTVQEGALVAPSGVRFQVLVLGEQADRLTLATLERLQALLDDGATIVGRRPIGSPSLADDDGAVAAAIERLWGPAAGASPRHVGTGWLFSSGDVASALRHVGLGPDWSWSGQADDLAIQHRQDAGRDLYFVVNRRQEEISGALSLRRGDREPEAWTAEDGAMAPLAYRQTNGRTVVPLKLSPGQALFIVLRAPASAPARTLPAKRQVAIAQLDDAWRLSFQAGRGAPTGERLAQAGSWTRSEEPSIRYFSGVAAYRRTLNLPRSLQGRQILDLGQVGDVAEVSVNGQVATTLWHAPYRADLTDLLKPGPNQITVKVANLWANRLIGDAQPGAERFARPAYPVYRPDAPLRASGLIGPVRLITEQ